MKKITKWNWKLDQWFEDKVWTKVPEEYSTPHMFFLFGMFSSFLVILFFSLINFLLF